MTGTEFARQPTSSSTTGTSLTLAVVKSLSDAAESHARELGKPFAIAIVDAGGHVLLVHRQDGVHAAASEISGAKARAAVLFNRPSGAVETLMGTDGRPTLLNLTSVLPGALAIQGALPIHFPVGSTDVADLVGAIGASGGSPDEDEAVAQAGLDTLTENAGDRR